jgi:hypothetical protein
MDRTAGTAQSWFAVAGLQASRPAADRMANAFFLRWPLVSVLELGASPEAVGFARHTLRLRWASGRARSG